MAKFLINPEYRIYRNFAFILLLSILIIPGFTATYGKQIGYGISVALGTILFFLYFVTIRFNLRVFIPKILFKQKYILYAVIILTGILFISIVSAFLNYSIEKYYNLDVVIEGQGSYRILNFITAFLMNGFYIMGISGVALLRHWIIYSQQINELEQAKIKSELEQLKSQINPNFLFNTIDNANVLSKKNPELASEVLIKLGKLLCYQLYDSKREKVLLSSVISFVHDFLTLEKVRRNHFDYSLTEEGDIKNILIPPLLFIPLVEYAIMVIPNNSVSTFMSVSFRVDENRLEFDCSYSPQDITLITQNEISGLDNVKRRLDLLYGSQYELMVKDEGVISKINLKIHL
jgi:sensor histidine kinase YesM